MSRFDAILFDADDTLFDYQKCEEKALRDTFMLYGHPCEDQTLADYRLINSEMWKMLERREITQTALRIKRFEALFTLLELPFDPDEFGNMYVKTLAEQRIMIEGAAELCRRLYRKAALYIVTNGIAAVQRSRFAGSAIQPYFNDLFISEDVGFHKPHPFFFDHVLSRIGKLSRRRVLIVGDSLTSDIRGGLDAGIVTCWFNAQGLHTPEDCTPDYEVLELADVAELV